MLLPIGKRVIVNQRLRSGDTPPVGVLNMAIYELMTIAKGKLAEDSARNLSNSVKDLVVSSSGRVLTSDFWGKRKFAYEIKGATDGWYDVIRFEAEPTSIAKLKQKLNIIDDLVRYIVINLSDDASENGGNNVKKS